MKQAVESAVVFNSPDRNSLDFLRRKKGKLDGVNLGGYGLRDVHLGDGPEGPVVDVAGSAK